MGLRQEMEKPHVENADLEDAMNRLYRDNAEVGSGSTAAAVRKETATGQAVKGKLHTQKAKDEIRYLEKWLEKNPKASSGDRAAAENVIKDLKNALE